MYYILYPTVWQYICVFYIVLILNAEAQKRNGWDLTNLNILSFCEGFFSHIFVRDSLLIFLWKILSSCLTRFWSFFPKKTMIFLMAYILIHYSRIWLFLQKFQIFRELYCITFDVFLRKLLWDFVVSMYSSVQQCSVVNLSFEWIVQLRWKHNLFYNEFSVWTIH